MNTDPEIIAAVNEYRACQAADSSIVATCGRIASQVDDEVGRLSSLVSATGVSATVERNPVGGGQLHSLIAAANTFADARAIADAAAGAGYVPWQTWSRGAEASFGRTASSLTMARVVDVTFVLDVRWVSTSRMPKASQPTAADWRTIELPTRLWPAYYFVRPVRLLGDRVGLRRQRSEPLGPILSTPNSLIDPLFDFASIDSSDHLVDLGCGDGRLVVEAARRRGCRAVGVENDPRLANLARARVAEAGIDELVDIIEADATYFDMSKASVVLLFLPAEVTASLVADLLGRSNFNGRIVAHEQEKIVSAPPEKSAVLVGHDALTVAHLWTT